MRPVEPPHHEGPEAPGVARRHQRVLGEEEQGEGAHDLGEAGRERVLEALAMAAGVEVQDHLGVGGGLKMEPAASSSWRSLVALVRLPLWATAMGPRWHSMR